MATKTIKLNDKVNEIVKNHEFLTNFLSGALYDSPWATCITRDGKKYQEAKAKLQNPCLEDVWAQMLLDGEKLTIMDNEDAKKHTITLDKVVNGFAYLILNHPTNYANIMDENDDMWDMDAFLQSVVFGEVIYG